jgi:hypothetical protein
MYREAGHSECPFRWILRRSQRSSAFRRTWIPYWRVCGPTSVHPFPVGTVCILATAATVNSGVLFRRDINDLPQFRKRGFDARCLDNLVNGENDTFNDRSRLHYVDCPTLVRTNGSTSDVWSNREMWLVPLSGPYSASQCGSLNTLWVLTPAFAVRELTRFVIRADTSC